MTILTKYAIRRIVDHSYLPQHGPLTWAEPHNRGWAKGREPRLFDTATKARRAFTIWLKGPIVSNGKETMKKGPENFASMYTGGPLYHDPKKAMYPRIREQWEIVEVHWVVGHRVPMDHKVSEGKTSRVAPTIT